MYLYLIATNNREFTGKSSLTSFCAESSEKKLCWFHELKSVVKVKIAQNNSQFLKEELQSNQVKIPFMN